MNTNNSITSPSRTSAGRGGEENSLSSNSTFQSSNTNTGAPGSNGNSNVRRSLPRAPVHLPPLISALNGSSTTAKIATMSHSSNVVMGTSTSRSSTLTSPSHPCAKDSCSLFTIGSNSERSSVSTYQSMGSTPPAQMTRTPVTVTSEGDHLYGSLLSRSGSAPNTLSWAAMWAAREEANGAALTSASDPSTATTRHSTTTEGGILAPIRSSFEDNANQFPPSSDRHNSGGGPMQRSPTYPLRNPVSTGSPRSHTPPPTLCPSPSCPHTTAYDGAGCSPMVMTSTCTFHSDVASLRSCSPAPPTHSPTRAFLRSGPLFGEVASPPERSDGRDECCCAGSTDSLPLFSMERQNTCPPLPLEETPAAETYDRISSPLCGDGDDSVSARRCPPTPPHPARVKHSVSRDNPIRRALAGAPPPDKKVGSERRTTVPKIALLDASASLQRDRFTECLALPGGTSANALPTKPINSGSRTTSSVPLPYPTRAGSIGSEPQSPLAGPQSSTRHVSLGGEKEMDSHPYHRPHAVTPTRIKGQRVLLPSRYMESLAVTPSHGILQKSKRKERRRRRQATTPQAGSARLSSEWVGCLTGNVDLNDYI